MATPGLLALAVVLLTSSLGPPDAGAQTSGVDVSLSVTVSTAPDSCGTEPTIEVPAGTTVWYCYRLTNNGEIVDTHDVTDSFGVLFTFQGEVLLPGESVTNIAMGFARSQVVTSTVQNSVSWRARSTGDVPEEITVQGSATVVVPSPTTTTLTTSSIPESPTSTTVAGSSSTTAEPVADDADDVRGVAPLSFAG